MAKNSNINWTDHTANFWWGCMKVSEGCTNCYAETLSKRYGKKIWGPAETTERELKKAVWKDVLKWDTEAKADGIRRRVFVSSMSDFLENHPQVTDWRAEAKLIIERLESLDVLLLTKRPQNASAFMTEWVYGKFPAHVWMGTTVENQRRAEERIPHLQQIPAKVRFLSVEPMLEAVDITRHNLSKGISWVICGGESGPACRPFLWDWARDLRDQCKSAGVAFWMKQGGGARNHRDQLEDIPEDLRVRELPR